MKIIDTGPDTAQKNMDIDACLLKELENFSEPILHFYDWKSPSATYGYFTKPEQHLKDLQRLDLARRPTGGGIIFHVTDFAFSFLLPVKHPRFSANTLENYKYVNNAVLNVIEKLFMSENPTLLEKNESTMNSPKFCMANPTVYDVMLHGKKVGGAAQRRTKDGFLHQGSILLAMPSDSFLDEMLRDPNISSSMKLNSFPLLEEKVNKDFLDDAKSMLKCGLKDYLGNMQPLKQ